MNTDRVRMWLELAIAIGAAVVAVIDFLARLREGEG